MKCYTYTNGETLSGIQDANGENQNTCAITINAPLDWDVDELVMRIQNKSQSDILLYCCATLTEGDSVSSVFPDDCVLLRCTDPLHIENCDNSCLEVRATVDVLDLVLFNQSSVLDEATRTLITNHEGELQLSKGYHAPVEVTPARLPKDVIISL